MYAALKPFFKQSFLVMSAEDEKTLAGHKSAFKLVSKQYAISTAIMEKTHMQDEAWRDAYSSY